MNNEGRSPGVVNYQGSGAAMLRRDLAYEKAGSAAPRQNKALEVLWRI
ncbi:MAG: hypothetical protein ACI4D1_07600 [Lachnospira sp.]